jgi:nucleotide-binding universal stress UspA family protein
MAAGRRTRDGERMTRRLVNSVVVGYDGSEGARRAVARAVAAAEPGGRVVLVTASPPPDALIREEELGASGGPDPNALLDDAAAFCRGRDVRVARRVSTADPADALADAAVKADADLIVVGARGRSFVARTLRGSVGERLVARAPCDVLVVR